MARSYALSEYAVEAIAPETVVGDIKKPFEANIEGHSSSAICCQTFVISGQ